MRLYGHGSSGNVYKAKLLMSMLEVDFQHIPTDFFEGTRTPEFRAMNPNGKVPVLVDRDFTLWESGAILAYLATDTPWFPEERRARARVLQWMFFEQYSHEPYIATARAAMHFRPDTPERAAFLARKREAGEHALAVMEGYLAGREWFVADDPTIADIALYAYTHVAHEGGFPLDGYPAIRAWCRRIEALPGYVAIDGFEDLVAN